MKKSHMDFKEYLQQLAHKDDEALITEADLLFIERIVIKEDGKVELKPEIQDGEED